MISTIGKGLYDMYAVNDLANEEVAARRELLESGYSQLSDKIDSYIETLSSLIVNQTNANHTKFINYVSSYK